MYKILRKDAAPHMARRVLDGMEYLTFPALEETGLVRHMFGTRVGGVSRGKYAEVNFSYTLGDEKEAVDENLKRAAAILGRGRSLEDFVMGHQTHTDHIRVVTEADRGKGTVRERDYSDVDGLVTNVPGLILTTYHADCPPVYILDPVRRAIGLAHSGWKGTVSRIGKRALEVMGETWGTDPADCICCIGPSICRDCYEVSSDVAEAFLSAFGERTGEERYLYPGKEEGKYQLDLWAAIRLTLLEAGVPAGQIHVTDICTRCNCGYLYSHRITGFERGNMAAFLMLEEEKGEAHAAPE